MKVDCEKPWILVMRDTKRGGACAWVRRDNSQKGACGMPTRYSIRSRSWSSPASVPIARNRGIRKPDAASSTSEALPASSRATLRCEEKGHGSARKQNLQIKRKRRKSRFSSRAKSRFSLKKRKHDIRCSSTLLFQSIYCH